MTSKDFKEMLDQMARGWMTQSYEEVADNFAENLHYSDSLNYTFFSKRDLLDFFRAEELPEECTFHQAVFEEEQQLGAAEYTYIGRNVYYGTVWVKIENDKVTSWREYQHISRKTREEFWNRKIQ